MKTKKNIGGALSTVIPKLTNKEITYRGRSKNNGKNKKLIGLSFGIYDAEYTLSDLRMSEETTKKYVNIIDSLENSVLGAGSFGKVYLLYNTDTNRLVACKIIDLYDTSTKEFKREVENQKKFSFECKPHVPTILKWGLIPDNKGLIVMDFIGEKQIWKCKYNIKPLTSIIKLIERDKINLKDCIEIIPQLFKLIRHIHSVGYYHCDLKTENLMFDIKNKILYIMDFGFTKKIDEIDGVEGTTEYMHPSDFSEFGNDKNTVISEYWAMGVILNEIFEYSSLYDKFASAKSVAKKKNSKLSNSLSKSRRTDLEDQTYTDILLQNRESFFPLPQNKNINKINSIFESKNYNKLLIDNNMNTLIHLLLNGDYPEVARVIENILNTCRLHPDPTDECTKSLLTITSEGKHLGV
tara:strand:+ start:1267 stop:2493 length:1227 start_codon:yes stop_codon:yes gene_type:complete